MSEPFVFDPTMLLERHGGARHHGSVIGIYYVAHGGDWTELALDYDAKLVGNPRTGVLASGPVIALMDIAAGLSVQIRNGRLRPMATLDLRVDYLRPSPPGERVIGRGECYRITRSIAFVRGEAHNGDPADPIANIAGTFMFTDA
jgi:uncharacterized protein (TIGR00369 family)